MSTSPYIDAPEPPDDEEILPGWTWGAHRQMEETLKELEASDENVKKARQQLDARLIEAGVMADPLAGKPQVCKGCGQPEFKPHDYDCEYRPAEPHEIPVRDAHGYQYYNENFEPLTISSVPCNDEEALDYFRIVKHITWSQEQHVKYVYKRAIGENDYKMMPYWFEWETGRVWHFDERKPPL